MPERDVLSKICLEDVVVFKGNKKTLLYSPLDKLILDLAADIFNELESKKSITQWREIVDPDGGLGLFATKKPAIDTYVSEDSYDGIVLLMTDMCNMDCRYCYASDSRQQRKVMDEKIWQAAIDVALNQRKEDSDFFSVAFHGYGECTLHSDTIKAIVAEIKSRLAPLKITPKFQVTTNGTFNSDFCAWMIQEGFRFDISIDGDKQINDLMRRSKSGQSHHDTIVRNLKQIAKSNSKEKLTVRATVTDQTVQAMADSTRFLAEIGIAGVHFEPITPRGGALKLGADHAVDIYDFTENYKKAIAVASGYEMKIYYGPVNFGIAVRFCSSRHKLVVDLHGRVLGCLQSGPDSGLDVFHYADIDLSKNQLSTFPGKIEIINSISVYNKPHCNGCLLKYHCSGDCTTHNLDLESHPEFIKHKCQANEKLFAYILEEIISDGNISAVLDFAPETTFQC